MPRDARRPTATRRARGGPALVVVVALAAVVGIGSSSALAQGSHEAPADPAAVAQRDGEAWLAGVQRADGGFALAGLAAVETSESVLALAGQAQTSDVWSDREAIDGVEARAAREDGPDVFAALSDLAGSTRSPADAALLITRVALPLGLDPTSFDPANRGRPVDLVALLGGATPEDSVASLAEVVPALVATGEDVPESLVTAIVDRRTDDGIWTGRGTGGTIDVRTTAAAVTALIATGLAPTDERVLPALRALATQQDETGGWGTDDLSVPADTAAGSSALRAAGFDPDEVCWQQELLGRTTDRPTPAERLIDVQAPDGHWGSADEAISTAVALQAMDGGWLPITPAEKRTCGGGFHWPLPAVPPGLVVIAGVGLIGLFGATRILRGDRTAL